MLKYRIF